MYQIKCRPRQPKVKADIRFQIATQRLAGACLENDAGAGRDARRHAGQAIDKKSTSGSSDSLTEPSALMLAVKGTTVGGEN